MPRLVFRDHAGRQQALELTPNRAQTVIGRHADCDIIAHDTSVSRRHCIISFEDGTYILTDLRSANGTTLNDARITRSRLAPGDVIRCGTYEVRFVASAEPGHRPQQSAPLPAAVDRAAIEQSLRAQVEQLQTFNETQASRLIQLQDELARTEAELQSARVAHRESEEVVYQLDALIRQREAELRQLQQASELNAPPVAPPPVVAPPPAEGPLALSALAADNEALRAEVSSLHAALATEDAYVRAVQLVPAVDRWRAVDRLRHRLAEQQARHDEQHQHHREQLRDQAEQITALQRELMTTGARLVETVGEGDLLRAELADAQSWLTAVGERFQSTPARPTEPAIDGEQIALRARVRQLESALVDLEGRAGEAERALLAVRAQEQEAARQLSAEADESTKRREALSTALGAVTRRGRERQEREARLSALEAARTEAEKVLAELDNEAGKLRAAAGSLPPTVRDRLTRYLTGVARARDRLRAAAATD